MKKSIVFALIAVLLLGCNSSNERVLTTATGSIYECLVVSEQELESTLTETMGADMYGLPQMEAVMTVTHIAPSTFDAQYMASRNILLVGIDGTRYTHVKAS